MRTAQGLPVNMIVLTALALLVLVVVGAFFISGFGSAGASVQVINASQASCQSDCQALTTMAYNYNNCGDLKTQVRAGEYISDCAPSFGTCSVILSTGDSCSIN